ncbi:MAG: hypothetical protein ACYC7E_13325 [Armatimonadota bacterium]
MRAAVGLLVTVNLPEVGSERAPDILARAAALLPRAGVDIVAQAVVGSAAEARKAAESFAGIDVLCVVAATWSEDFLVQEVLAELPAPVPVIAWGLPGLHTGSLCGTQQLCCVLKEIQVPYRFVYGELDDVEAQRRAVAYAHATAVQRTLRRTRLGRVGGRMPGMAEVAVDELELRARFGVRLVERSLGWLTEQAEAADAGKAENIWHGICARVGQVDVPGTEGLQAARYYLALRQFVDEELISALTVECYPSLMGRVCLPFALLAEDDVVCACEGDVNSALAMRLLGWFTDKPIHNTDLLADNPEDNTIVFSHCGSSALCLAGSRQEVALKSCRLMDVGVTAHFPGRPGRVTLLNIVGRRGTYRMGAVTGEAVPTEMVFPGNPVKVRLDAPLRPFLEEVAEVGLGHHWMIGEGDALPELQALGRLLNIPVHQPGGGPVMTCNASIW